MKLGWVVVVVDHYLKTRLWFAALAAACALVLSAVPSVYALILADRAIPSRSIETVAVLGVLACLLMGVNVALAHSATQYLAACWAVARSIVAPNSKQEALRVIDTAVRANVPWDLLCLCMTPILIAGLVAAHWSFLLLIALLVVAIWAAQQLGQSIASQGLVAGATVLAMGLSALLAIWGILSPGVLLSAAFLVASICSRVFAVFRNLQLAKAAIHSFRLILAANTLKAGPVPASDDVTRYGNRLAACCVTTGALVVLPLAVPVPGTTVMTGVVSPDGHAAAIKSIVTSRVSTLLVREGDHVSRGDTLLTLDGADYTKQRESIIAQARLEETTLQASTSARTKAQQLVSSRVTATEDLVKRGLRPQSDLTEALIYQSTEEREWLERSYARRSTILKLQERLAEVDRVLTGTVIAAPRNGRVQQIEAGPPGTPVAIGDALLTVVPDSDPIIEAKLDPVDRASVAADTQAEVRIKTSFVRFGRAIRAQVRTVSSDRYDDGAFRVVLTPSEPIALGTEVEVTIIGQPQTAAGWLSSIVTSSVRRAIR